jgi:hypothetical protein
MQAYIFLVKLVISCFNESEKRVNAMMEQNC